MKGQTWGWGLRNKLYFPTFSLLSLVMSGVPCKDRRDPGMIQTNFGMENDLHAGRVSW